MFHLNPYWVPIIPSPAESTNQVISAYWCVGEHVAFISLVLRSDDPTFQNWINNNMQHMYIAVAYANLMGNPKSQFIKPLDIWNTLDRRWTASAAALLPCHTELDRKNPWCNWDCQENAWWWSAYYTPKDSNGHFPLEARSHFLSGYRLSSKKTVVQFPIYLEVYILEL